MVKPSLSQENQGSALEVITIGRSGVDIYPLQVGVGLENVTSFGKFLGGSPTNVAVAAARLGRCAAAVTGVGDDPFGRFVVQEMERLGVSSAFVVTDADLATPVTFCEIYPPDDFPLFFYRDPSAPDLQLRPEDLDFDAIAAAPLFWISGTGLSCDPSRSAHFEALRARAEVARGSGVQAKTPAPGTQLSAVSPGAPRHTVFDLDYRAMFWQSREQAREYVQQALALCTVAVGNREECEVAVGQSDPDRAADALLDLGVELAIVKQGPRGVLGKTRTERVEVPANRIRVINGLGAGDSFGGSLCHGLLAGHDLTTLLTRCNAAGAIVSSRLECSTAMPTAEEIDMLLAGDDPNRGSSVEEMLTSLRNRVR
ncbi:5-dehydro-2-deoxygluconokinase [Devriesea agamarum]|uniref:5-dehydro-2-deoxygluconokinase n=1 Tax=Devriesea agamarum TaxID=472569 RepID=UPI00071D9647|nr:5-dehydro-2-deoxygluconokinase [Devriesea agamarum]